MFQYFINLLYTYYTSIYRFLKYFLRISNDSNKYIGTTCSSRFDSFFKIKERTTFKDIFSIPSVLVYELNQSLRTIRKKIVNFKVKFKCFETIWISHTMSTCTHFAQ